MTSGNQAYQIQTGDTLSSIASQFAVSTGMVSSSNPSYPLLPLGILPSPGSVLVIPSPLTPPFPGLALTGISLLLFPHKIKTIAYVAIGLYLYQLYQTYQLGGVGALKMSADALRTQGLLQVGISVI